MITYKSVPDYIMRNIAGDNVLIKTHNIDSGNSSVFVFNDSGAYLWNNLSEYKNKDQLVSLLSDEYGIERTQAEADVDQFLDKCMKEGFVIEYREEL